MTRRQILAEVLARLEAERFAPPRPEPPPCSPLPPPVTDADAASNARRLLEAIGDDPVVAAWAEREAG